MFKNTITVERNMKTFTLHLLTNPKQLQSQSDPTAFKVAANEQNSCLKNTRPIGVGTTQATGREQKPCGEPSTVSVGFHPRAGHQCVKHEDRGFGEGACHSYMHFLLTSLELNGCCLICREQASLVCRTPVGILPDPDLTSKRLCHEPRHHPFCCCCCCQT